MPPHTNQGRQRPRASLNCDRGWSLLASTPCPKKDWPSEGPFTRPAPGNHSRGSTHSSLLTCFGERWLPQPALVHRLSCPSQPLPLPTAFSAHPALPQPPVVRQHFLLTDQQEWPSTTDLPALARARLTARCSDPAAPEPPGKLVHVPTPRPHSGPNDQNLWERVTDICP